MATYSVNLEGINLCLYLPLFYVRLAERSAYVDESALFRWGVPETTNYHPKLTTLSFEASRGMLPSGNTCQYPQRS